VVPMERECRIIGGSSTPRFAKMVSWKYGQLPASKVSEDLSMNHCRKTSRKLIQSLGAAVGEVARENEFEWTYEMPAMGDVVTHISVSRDGTTTPIVKEGYRETMCGTLSFYNSKGDRMHTIYTACAPEYGKESFDSVMDMELQQIKKQYPRLTYIGLADGAKNNWMYLKSRTEIHILDFFHATEHLAEVSVVMRKDETRRRQWLEEACHDLKHKSKGAQLILRELREHRKQFSSTIPEILEQTITYFENNLPRMHYARYQKKGYPIGSGVTEAACKVLAKQRLSNSGMRWTIPAAQHILLLRGLICTEGRWQQFWKHIDKNGI
jgi:hypothetical protein